MRIAWLRKLLIPCPKCDAKARRAAAPYITAYRRYHDRENHGPWSAHS
jgi:hypothetical protein